MTSDRDTLDATSFPPLSLAGTQRPRHRSLPAIVRLQQWRRHAPVEQLPFRSGATERIFVRRVNGHDDPIVSILEDARFRLEVSARGKAFRIALVDPWIDGYIAKLAEISLREPYERFVSASPRSAEYWQVLDGALLEAEIERFTGSRREERLAQVRQLIEHSVRPLPMATHDNVQAIRALERDFPNFRPAIDRLAQSLALASRLGTRVSVPRLLLHGEPGTGKTEFARRVAEALGLYFVSIPMPQVTAGWNLTGLNATWNGSQMGWIAAAVRDCPLGQIPLIFFDEICKVAGASQSPVEPVLLQCLEPSTAAKFNDEFVGVPMDLRPVAMMFASNRLDTIRPETLDRLEPVPVRRPTNEEMPMVIRSVDRGIRARTPALGKLFARLDDDVIARLCALRPREVRKALEQCYAQAAEQAPAELQYLRVKQADVVEILRKQVVAVSNPEMPMPRPKISSAIDIARLMMLFSWEPNAKH